MREGPGGQARRHVLTMVMSRGFSNSLNRILLVPAAEVITEAGLSSPVAVVRALRATRRASGWPGWRDMRSRRVARKFLDPIILERPVPSVHATRSFSERQALRVCFQAVTG